MPWHVCHQAKTSLGHDHALDALKTSAPLHGLLGTMPKMQVLPRHSLHAWMLPAAFSR